MWKFAITSLFILSALLACKKNGNDLVAADFGFDYYPEKKGHYSVYEVNEITYDDFFEPVKIDSLHYFIKEIVDSNIVDNSGRPSLQISRYQRISDTNRWQLKDVWYATKTAQRVEVVEENQRIIKLIFPLRISKSWDGNAMNGEEEQKYSVTGLNEQQTINGRSFDAVVSILQKNVENLIEKKYAEEKYARGIGLVYKKEKDLTTEINGTIVKGFDKTMILVDDGEL